MIGWFKEYVLHYTNAATLIQEGFQDTEDLDGLFSGLDPETGVYDVVSGRWGYEGSPSGRRRGASRPTRPHAPELSTGGPEGGPRLRHRRRAPAARRVAIGDDVQTQRPAAHATRPCSTPVASFRS